MSRESEVKRLLAGLILSYLTAFIGLAGFSNLTGEQIRVTLVMVSAVLVAITLGMIVKRIAQSVLQAMVAALMTLCAGIGLALVIFIGSFF